MSRHPILYSILIVGVILVFIVGAFAFFISLSFRGGNNYASDGDIAVIKIEGPIFESEKVLKNFDKIARNRSIKAVVVRIDSPGGAVAPSQEIYEELKKIKQSKKVVISMGTVAASGAYYISIAGDKILASRGTITGSIGVIMESVGLQELLKLARLESRVLKSGKFKDVGNPYREMTPEEKAFLQDLINNIYAQFKGAVSLERKISMEKMSEIAQGQIYSGEQALELGLIDGYGTIYDAIDEAKKLAGLDEDASVIWPEEKNNPFDFLMSKIQGRPSTLESLLEKVMMGNEPYPLWLYSLDSVNIY